MKLYTQTPYNLLTQTTQIVAEMAKVNVETVIVSEEQQKDKEFQAKKLMQFPFLETADGEQIFESSAIATYFARCAPASGLYGQSPFQQAKIDEWISWNQFVWSETTAAIYGVFGRKEMPQAQFAETMKKLKSHMKILDSYLDGKYYLVGDNITIADIMVAMYLSLPFQTLFDAGYRKAIPNATEWFEKIVSLPAVIKTIGYIKLSDKAFKAFDPNAKVEPIKEQAPAQAKGGKKEKGGAKGKQNKPKEEEEVDMDDLFGDDDADDGKAAKEAAAKAKDAAGKKKKKEVIAMSIVMLEVKPLDDQVDLDKLAAHLFKNITQDGLFWKTQYKKEPVAFGIFKLIVGFSLEDEKVSVDDVVERIEGIEDMVQSVEIQAFNKI